MVNGSTAAPPPQEDDARGSTEPRVSSHDLRASAARPPVLASEALREEVAPIEPGNLALRLWIFGLGLVVALSGLAFRLGWIQGSPLHARVAFGVAAAVVVAVAVPYRFRGYLVAGAGFTLVVLGVLGIGPLSAIAAAPWSSPWAELARMLAASVLPAALLFRARYRAYRGARIALIVALALTIPALVHAGLVIASGPLWEKIAAACTILSVVASLTGFMGAGTTGASTAWAVTVVIAFGLDVAARMFWMEGPRVARIGQFHAGLLFMVAASLSAIGFFKVLASVLAKDARRVDVLDTGSPTESVQEGSDGSD